MNCINLKISNTFFDEEIRDGYKVSREMKKIWAVELDLLNELNRVCNKHNIRCMACAGTMLGAIRHKGFIPWDDDIDIMLFRDDYEKLCEIAPSEFTYPYFFQTEKTDPGSLRGHAQLRNSDTTGILKSELKSKMNINQGIFIDIFPLDNVPNEENKCTLFLKESKRLWKSFCYYKRMSTQPNFHRRNIFGLLIDIVLFYIIPHSYAQRKCKECYIEYENHQMKYNHVDTKNVVTTPISVVKYNREDLKTTRIVPFEMLNITVPQNSEKVLDYVYRNWRVPVIGTSFHGGVIFDTERSYKEYIKD